MMRPEVSFPDFTSYVFVFTPNVDGYDVGGYEVKSNVDGYEVKSGNVDGYEVKSGNVDGYEVKSGNVDGYEVKSGSDPVGSENDQSTRVRQS